MRKIDLGQGITILANLGVIAGIVFLAVEISQNTRSLEVGAYQELMGNLVQMNANSWDNPTASRIVREGLDVSLSELDGNDYEIVTSFVFMIFRHGDLAYHQHERGVIGPDRLESALGPLRDNRCKPPFREIWSDYRDNFVPTYQEYIDELMSEC